MNPDEKKINRKNPPKENGARKLRFNVRIVQFYWCRKLNVKYLFIMGSSLS